ncbi:sensor domain-containing protein [Planococcus sp. FY231025]|uniref:sensor domain-containing protein n=1 Tax=Planococcus sp. FY231025 TaxID=3455699 RepID=UPI003F92A7AE
MKHIANKFFMELIETNTPMGTAFYQEMFEVTVQNAPISMYVLKEDSYSFINKHFCELLGYAESEILNGQITFTDLVHPDDISIMKERLVKRVEEQNKSDQYRIRFFKKNREMIVVEVYGKKMVWNGETFLVGAIVDVTAEVQATAQMLETQERFKSLFDNNPDAVYTFDLVGNFIDANPACERLTGYSAAELADIAFMPLVVPEDLPTTLYNFNKAILGETVTYEIFITPKDGQRRAVQISNFPMKLKGEVIGVYGVAVDITERNENKKLMEELIFFDSLTKLPNRKLFEDRLRQVFKISQLHNHKLAVLFLGLDRFKFINDSLGHYMGDEFLKAVAQCLKETVGEADTVARVAGDEFAILLPDAKEEEVHLLAAKLNQVMAEPFKVLGHSLSVSCSVGIAFSGREEETVEELIKKADAAMYFTKKYGKNNYTVYSDELDQKTAYKLIIEKDLKEAVQNNEFVLHYQPITNLKTGELSAVEALIRWNHPTLGFVSPADFIPISEETGQIISLGKWVLHTACAQIKEWQEMDYPPFGICVNISTIQLQQPDFVETVKEALQQTGLDAKWLELEVTESILIEDTKILKQNLVDLKKLGISISIDDFGTGFTSLSYLQQYSFDRVKIDRSFVSDINEELKGKTITSTIISLAHQLNMSVIAEGIEDEHQLAYLIQENCDEGQGYYFSRPVPAEAFGVSLVSKKFC